MDRPNVRPECVVRDIPWNKIRPMPGQPREYFDKTELQSLATSIKAVGQRVPAQVAPVSDEQYAFELIDGQRRWHAVQLAGVDVLRCEIVDESNADTRYILSVVANMARAGHHPMEIANACHRMRQVTDEATGRPLTLDRIADMLGRSRGFVDQHLSLLRLVPEIAERIHPSVTKDRKLPFSAAILLSRLEPEEQVTALERISARNTSPLRATKRVIEEMPNGRKRQKRSPMDKYRTLMSLLRRTAEDLEVYPSDQFQALIAARDGDDVARLRSNLERISTSVDRMLSDMPGGSTLLG